MPLLQVWVCFVLGFCGFFVLSIAAQSQTAGVPEANPGRPTVSTPATLTPVGYLQFENGIVLAIDSPEFSSQFAVNQVTKLTVHPRLQLILQSQPLVISQSEGQAAVEAGDVFGGAQFVLFTGKSKPTVSVSYIRRLHESPAPDIDIGTFRQSGLILVSGDMHGFHVDANGIITEQIEGGVRRAQFGETVSISHHLGKLVISGEIWHFSQPLQGGNAVGNLWAASYPWRKNLVVDGGFNHGFTKSSTRWEAFLGFTYLFPTRLWKHGITNNRQSN